MDDQTRREIDKAVTLMLRDAGLKEPPYKIEDVLQHLKVHRGFYDLKDPMLLQRFWHKVKVKKERLVRVVRKIKLAAVWLPDEEHILIDTSLPAPKQEWATFHDAVHRILEWHRPYFLGDTAQTLDPDFQMMLESEANYGASALMFGGKTFTREALDTVPEWASIKALQKRYGKSCVTTLRRYVQFSLDIPMAMMVSTPWWKDKLEDQECRWRHFLGSARFETEFACVNPDEVVAEIDSSTSMRSGGPVGEFEIVLTDMDGESHEFRAESFFNQHDILTLIVHQRKLRRRPSDTSKSRKIQAVGFGDPLWF
jgi:hypothetical protein